MFWVIFDCISRILLFAKSELATVLAFDPADDDDEAEEEAVDDAVGFSVFVFPEDFAAMESGVRSSRITIKNNVVIFNPNDIEWTLISST
jgi:hypothetical protein